jgi:hypothetical protein
MEVSEKHRIDVSRVDANALHVRKERRAAIEQQAAVDHHRTVVAIGGKGGPRAEEGQP